VRIPIRARLTAWYAVVVAAIIASLGAFVVLELSGDLRARIDDDLTASSAEIARGYAEEGPSEFRDVSRAILPRGQSSAQVLDPAGRVLVFTGVARQRPIAPADARRAALAGDRRIITVALGPDGQSFRALVAPVHRHGRLEVMAIAESLSDVEAATHRLLVLLLLAGPAALAATILGGWWLARKALRPVEQMTSQAEEIGIDRLDERIVVPPSRDELAHLAVTLNAMLGRLQRGVDEQHRLIADASHELRTPLAVMRAELDVTLRERDTPPAARALLESVREEVDRVSRTVENLLTLSQIDEGRMELLRTRVSLREAIEEAARPLHSLAEAKGVRLELDGGACEVEADSHRLHQALTNYLENGIKFAPSGGEVRATAWCRDAEAGVTVTDDGPGVPVDARQHIFDRFYRVDDARGREAGGSGLGLAICREIAHAHGGRVWVDSEEGSGSAFSLSLPRSVEPRRAAAPARTRG
jgi:heavy metal sensor kinase